jgi:hypothetical protein
MQTANFMCKAALILAASTSAWASDSTVISDELPRAEKAHISASIEPALPSLSVEVAGFGVPMDSTQLEQHRGGYDAVKNDMQLSGTVANNAAFNVLTGSNFIADGSFSNASGFPMVIQNTGANVLIQNATIVNVQFQ